MLRRYAVCTSPLQPPAPPAAACGSSRHLPPCPPRWRPLRCSCRACACAALASALSLEGGCDEFRELRLVCSRNRVTSAANAVTTACTSLGVCAHKVAEIRWSGGFKVEDSWPIILPLMSLAGTTLK